jgi:hypothetical protein
LTKLPYPSYKEHRNPENYESNQLLKKAFSKFEKVKIEQGERAVQEYILKRSFSTISYWLFGKNMLEYLRIIRKQDSKEFYPHPMLKAMLMAMTHAETLNKENEKVASVASDADYSSDGKGWIYFFVGAQMKNGICSIDVIKDIQNQEVQIDMMVVEKILRTELIIERTSGREISSSAFIEALSAIGVRAKMIPRKEISEAIVYVKELIAKQKVEGADRKLLDAIRDTESAEKWDSLDTVPRTLIVSCYGSYSYPGYDMYLTPFDNVEKTKCRMTVLQALYKSQFVRTT